MSRISSEKAVKAIGNRFDLVLIATIRQRELDRGFQSKIKKENSNHLTALQEIEEGHIGVEYLKRLGNHVPGKENPRKKKKF